MRDAVRAGDGRRAPRGVRGSACDRSDAPRCGPHGRCEGEPARCVCEPSYAGPTCTACAEGYQDNDGDGTCAPSCAGMECGAHERCDDASGLPVCACVHGYVREVTVDGSGSACVFRGGPLDPGFSASAWTATGGAVLDRSADPTTVPGALDDGWVQFHGAGAAAQSFAMPAFTDAEPLAIEVNAGCKGACANVEGALLSIALGDRSFDLPLSAGALSLRRVCLGDRAFGRTVDLAISTSGEVVASPEEDALVDRVRFVPDAECPAPGQVVNADFEGAGGWAPGGLGITEVAGGVGTNGSRAGRLVGNGCERPSLTSIVSVPQALARPALVFAFRGTRDREAFVSLDETPIGTLRGTGTYEQAVVCLPEWSRGFARRLRVTAGERITTCNLPGANEVIVDDFEVRSHPSCPEAPLVLDGDFERTTGNAWAEGVTDGASVAVVHDDPASAHGGDSLLQLSTFSCSRQIVASQVVAAPARGPASAGGPALAFWYRTVNGGGGTKYGASAGGPLTSLPPAETWTKTRVCIPPSAWGRAQEVGFSVSSPAAVWCGASLQIDDVEVTTDPECPAD